MTTQVADVKKATSEGHGAAMEHPSDFRLGGQAV